MKPRFASVLGLVLMFGVALWSTLALSQATVATTKHNLSTSGTYSIKSTTEVEVCVFCHVPHNASSAAPLWNRANPTGTYTPYSSTTMKGTMGQPNGTSLLCLSCHDGTIALGEILSRAAISVNGQTTFKMPAGVSNLGTDLSNDHPVSFVYDDALATNKGEMVLPSTLTGAVKLDKAKQMQCSSCHDAHNDTNGKFLVMKNNASALCITCHTKTNWTKSSHEAATNTYTGLTNTYNGTTYGTPWTHTTGITVAANACENCHRPHTALGAKRLLNYAKEEDNCLVCHNGNAMSGFTAKNNILADYAKTSSHGGGTAGVMSLIGIHDPNTTNEPANVTTKHVECADCHNPHQTKGPASTNGAGSNPTGTNLPTPLTGVRGVTIAGGAVDSATREEEICFRCHGDTASTAAVDPSKPTLVARKVIASPVGSIRAKFQTSNVSYHPVAGPVPSTAKSASLITGAGNWTSASTMKCTHCHNSNTAPTVGTGTGPNGPHGSTNRPILAKSYTYQDTGSNAQAALCYGCHNSNIVNADNAASFAYHAKHIGSGMACSACHDPHGVPGGTLANNRFLINFDTTVALPNGTTPATWTYVSANKGTCNMICHGKTHTGTGKFAY